MRIWADCIPCILKMALDVARLAMKDEGQVRDFMGEILGMPSLRGEAWDITSPEIIQDIWARMVGLTNDPDPLRNVKAEQNKMALALYAQARGSVRKSRDPLLTALKFCIAGNAMDVMVSATHDGLPAGFQTDSLVITLEGVEGLRKRLGEAGRVVYLCDNCGEIVFDRLFLEVLQEERRRDITIVVRNLPVLNDATMEDAVAVGLDSIGPVIKNGIPVPYPGTRLGLVSKEVRELLLNTDLIISKGGGNLDSLTEEPELKGKISFLFHGKCHPCCALVSVGGGTLVVDNL